MKKMNIFTKTKNTIMSGKNDNNLNVGSIDEIGLGVVSGDVVLYPDKYAGFWTTIAHDRQSCARYMARIVVTLLNFEHDPVKAEKSLQSKTDVVSAKHFINLLLNTTQFIDMFLGFDPKTEAFVSAMDKFELARKSNPVFHNKKIYDGLLDLSKRRAHRGQAAVKMIVECSSLESDEEMRHSSNEHRSKPRSSNATALAAYDDSEFSFFEKPFIEFPFTFTGLSRMTKTHYSTNIYDELLHQLESAGSALSSMASLQGRTLALMFMLREFITISPTADHMWIQRASLVLMGLYKWPKPYGRVAKELLDFLHLERRSPGCHLRDRIFEENPALHPLVMLKTHSVNYTPLHPKDKSGQLRPLHSLFVPPSRTCPISFVFLDKSVPLCCCHKYLLLQGGTALPATPPKSSLTASSSESSSLPQNEKMIMNEMRVSLLTNAFDTDFVVFPNVDAKSKNKIKDPLSLMRLSEEDITILFCQVMEILERAKSLPVNAGTGGERADNDMNGLPVTIPGGLSKLYRESLLGSLLQRLHPDKIFAPRRSSDEKVMHIARQSRRTSLMQQDNVTERKTVIEDSAVKAENEVFNARQESKRLAQVLPPDEMAKLGTNLDDESGRQETKTIFNTTENTVHDPVLFGQRAPQMPDHLIEVIDVNKKSRNVGDELESASLLTSQPSKEDYTYSTNSAGYLYNKQDVDDLVAVIERAKQTWSLNFDCESIGIDMVKLSVDERKTDFSDSVVGAEVERVGGCEKIKIKVVLMGSNLVVHRFLSAYVALYTEKGFNLSDFEFEVFVVPQGKNHLGIYLARLDKWYRRHVFDSFKGPLGICPQYSAVGDYCNSEFDNVTIQNCSPVKNLRMLLHNFVRQAKQKYSFSVFECLCWAADDDEVSKKKSSGSDGADDLNVFNQKNTPDIIIPFVTQVQIGFHAHLEYFRDKPSTNSNHEKRHEKKHTLPAPQENGKLSMRKCFADKFNGVDLALQYLPSSITAPTGNNKVGNQKMLASSTLEDKFSTLRIANFPCHNTSRDDFSGGQSNTVTMPSEQLIMESQLFKGSIVDAFNNRRKNEKCMDVFLDALHDPSSFEHPQHIGAIEINSKPGESFHILVDGSLYGPFRRLTIRSCSVNEGTSSDDEVEEEKSDEILTIPLMTYMPLHQ